jgi:hypothetical protein
VMRRTIFWVHCQVGSVGSRYLRNWKLEKLYVFLRHMFAANLKPSKLFFIQTCHFYVCSYFQVL